MNKLWCIIKRNKWEIEFYNNLTLIDFINFLSEDDEEDLETEQDYLNFLISHEWEDEGFVEYYYFCIENNRLIQEFPTEEELRQGIKIYLNVKVH